MSKAHSIYICQQCGYHSPTYLGKCPQCDSWNSFVETVEESHQSSAISRQKKEKAKIINISDIKTTDYKRLNTGLEEFNRVLGGGIVLGSIILVSGDPGIGKSTLLTQLALNVNQSSVPTNSIRAGSSTENTVGIIRRQSSDKTSLEAESEAVLKTEDSCVLYVAGEESAQQIKLRVDRMKPKAGLSVLNETDVDQIMNAIVEARPGLVIVDSIQTMETADLNSAAGSIGQIRECTHRLQRLAKELHVPIFLVGHVNKDGMVAGPKTLEHMVDVVLSLEGDPASNFRILRGSKNRFGPTDEVGIFEMEDNGLVEVINPSRLFLNQKTNAPGSAVVATVNGTRPLIVEVQALVTKSFLPIPRRTGSGVDNNRLQLLVAVLMKRLGLPLLDKDIFVNVTGGLKMMEPAADLGLCMAIISSLQEKIISPKTAFVGEVGLLGEIREVRFLEKREKEAKKLMFSEIISSKTAKNLTEALRKTFK